MPPSRGTGEDPLLSSAFSGRFSARYTPTMQREGHGPHPHRWSGAEKDKQALRKGAYTLKVLDSGRTDEVLVGSSTISYL